MTKPYADMTPEEQAEAREKIEWQKAYDAAHERARIERQQEQDRRIAKALRDAIAKTQPPAKSPEVIEREAEGRREWCQRMAAVNQRIAQQRREWQNAQRQKMIAELEKGIEP